jgi:hypothetical protein
MVAGILIAVGVVLMLFGVVMLGGWVAGKSNWFDSGVFDRAGTSKTDRQFLDLYFVAIVLAPLFFGGLLIVLGLRTLQ